MKVAGSMISWSSECGALLLHQHTASVDIVWIVRVSDRSITICVVSYQHISSIYCGDPCWCKPEARRKGKTCTIGDSGEKMWKCVNIDQADQGLCAPFMVTCRYVRFCFRQFSHILHCTPLVCHYTSSSYVDLYIAESSNANRVDIMGPALIKPAGSPDYVPR